MSDLYVRSLKRHTATEKDGSPQMYPGTRYKTTHGLANRRERAGLVEVIGEEKEFQPDIEGRVPEGPTETKEEEPSTTEVTQRTPTNPEDLIEPTTENSPWYNVEGYDDNPVQGRENALDIARDLLQ